MERGFVAYIDYLESGAYKVAIGYHGTWKETQFIEIEYTDSGKKIHFFDDSNIEKLEQKFHEYITSITHKEYKNEYQFFNGNEKLKEVIDKYKTFGVDYVHDTDCNCAACQIFDGINFRGDTINRVIKELGEETSEQ
ncbi:MAG: hypothetical protein ACOYMA_15915 [Bacteroidia bacterium]